MKTLSPKHIKLSDIVFEIIRSLTETSSDFFKKFIQKISMNNKNITRFKLIKNANVVFLIVTWIIFSTLLTKSFSGLLLKTYFNPKSYLIVNSIQDIIEAPDLRVGGSYALSFLKESKPKEYCKLRKRVTNFERKLFKNKTFRWKDLSESYQILQQVLSGKTVLLVNSHLAEIAQRMNPDLSLSTAPDKWFPTVSTLFMSRKHFCYKRIVFK